MRLPFHLRLNALSVRQWTSEWTTADKPVLGERRSHPAPRDTANPGLSFQLRGHRMACTALTMGCEILVHYSTLSGLVESRRKCGRFGLNFGLISSGNHRIQLFLLRFNSRE